MRIGWLAGPPALAARLREIRHFYDVTDMAVTAALASLDDPAEVARRRAANDEQRARLQSAFDALGLAHLPSQTNFVTVDVGDAVQGVLVEVEPGGAERQVVVDDDRIGADPLGHGVGGVVGDGRRACAAARPNEGDRATDEGLGRVGE